MKIIGWKEKIDFLDFGIFEVHAKVDTGAKTSVLHCQQIKVTQQAGEKWVRFIPIGNTNKKEFTLPVHSEKSIKNSFGFQENRVTVITKVQFFNEIFSLEISLRDRSNMAYPMLMGRNFIRKKYLVDVSQAYLASHRTDN